MAGERIPFWMVTRGDKYYVRRGEWTIKQKFAAFCTEELATQLAFRYSATVEEDSGYEPLHHKRTLEDVGERPVEALLIESVTIAKREGWSLETLLMKAEQAYHTADVPKQAPLQEPPLTRADIIQIVQQALKVGNA